MKPRSSFDITRAVWFALVQREVVALMGRRRMGAFWALAEPLLHLLVISLIFSILRNRPDIAGHPYPLFMLVGLAPFLVYRRIVLMIAEGVGGSRALFAYKQITPIDTFVARGLVALGLNAIAYILIISGFAWYGWDVSVQDPLQWVWTICVGLFFAGGLGLVLAAVVNAIPDSIVVIRMAMFPFYFISGVIFPPSHMPPELLPYLMWNPLLHLCELMHAAVLSHYEPVYGVSMTYVLGVTLVLLCAGLGLYRVLRLKYIAISG